MSTLETLPTTDSTVPQYPRSRKIHVAGSRADIRVPMREISLDDTPAGFGTAETNSPVTVYDTSGPYTDPTVRIDLRKGLPEVRRAWIDDRDDTVALEDFSAEF